MMEIGIIVARNFEIMAASLEKKKKRRGVHFRDVDKGDVSFLRCQERRLFIFEMSTKEMIHVLSTKQNLNQEATKKQQNRAEEREF